MQNVYHVQTRVLRHVLAPVSMDALDVQVDVQVDVVLHVMGVNQVTVVQAALFGAQAAQVHAKDVVVVVVVAVHEIAVVGAEVIVEVVVVVTVALDVLQVVHLVVVTLPELELLYDW